jgi:hypothetical protein
MDIIKPIYFISESSGEMVEALKLTQVSVPVQLPEGVEEQDQKQKA